ncbi:hypothetical protein ACFCV3_24355 [Kribbella sp. NPDC056345]|uniref:hypothetical protein n=1 Tax=Kribbella sp. NPDC056345 TaxID=3345789 RepID=UPI0035DE5AFF
MTDLKDLLRNAAAEAENVSVDGSALLAHIRRRRRVRSAAIGAGSVAAVATLAVGAYAVLPGPAVEVQPPVSGGPAKPMGGPTSAKGDEGLRCGSSVAPTNRSGTPELLISQSMTKESMTRHGDGWRGTLATKVTNTSKVTLYGGNPPRGYLVVQENKKGNTVLGRAKATPGNTGTVLQPGESKWTDDVPFTVTSCNGKQMPSGWYLLYLDGKAPKVAVGRVHL